MTPPPHLKTTRAALVCVLVFLLGISPGAAQTTWSTTPADGLMSSGGNWSGGVAPSDGGSWLFTNSSVTVLTNDFTGYTVDGITFTTNATNTTTGAGYTIGGNAFTLTGGITNNSTNVQTISNALTINSAVNLSNTGNVGIALLTLLGNLSGNGTITYGSVANSGRLTLQTGSHAGFTGAFIANSGRINLGNNQSSASADYTFNNAGGTFLTTANTTFNFGSLSGTGTIANNSANNTNTVSIGAKGTSTTFSGNISTNQSGTINVVKVGAGTLTLAGSNNYIGTTTIRDGVLALTGDGLISASTAVSVASTSTNAATFDISGISGADLTVASISANTNGTIALGDKNLTVGGNNSSTTVAGGSIITGTGALTKTGAGTLSIGAANTFSGGFVLDQGWTRLLENSVLSGGDIASGALGVGNITINGGGLFGAGRALTATNITINGDFAVNSGTNSFNGRLSVGANLIDLGGATRTVSLGRYTNAAASLASGIESLRFITNAGFYSPAMTNGTFRFVRDSEGSASDYASVAFGSTNIQFHGGSGFIVGTNVIAVLGPSLLFANSSGVLPHVGTEDGGIFNLGITNSAGQQIIRSLSGTAGYVTSLGTLTNPITTALTISNQAGDYYDYGGQIVTGSSLNATLGTTAINVTFALTKTGAGTQVLSGLNTYSGNTTVNDGLLELGVNGALTFYIGASGSNNAITGAGSTLLRGTFVFDLAGAATNAGASWTIVEAANNRVYDGNFRVAGFTNSGGNWFRGENGVTYRFSQADNTLVVASDTPTDPYASWLTNFPSLSGTNAVPTADPDGDGFINEMEFAFGGNPTIGTPALLTAASQSGNALFSFVADTNSFTYTVQSTVDLKTGPWTNTTLSISNSPDQTGLVLSNYVRRAFTVPLTGKSFYRVEATPQP
jgi:fibronectin-binding autotransporter adhesin